NPRGNYVFPLITPGSYSVRAAKKDYLGNEYPRIVVPLNQPKLVIPAFALSKIGTATSRQSNGVANGTSQQGVFSLVPPAQVPVVSPPPAGMGLTSLVSLQDWAVRSNFDSPTILGLPLRGGRTFDQLALFAPGVAHAPFSSGEGPAVGIGVGSIG